MARRRRDPLFRTSLYPIVESWVTGPGLTYSVLRFALMASWSITDSEEGLWVLRPGMIAPELPFSVIPRSLREALQLQPLAELPDAWRSRPVPTWHGIPCRLGSVFMRTVNQQVPAVPLVFRLLVLMPERDSPGPRSDHVVVGSEFLVHYGLRVILDYDRILFAEDAASAQRRLDSSVSCGELEKG
jgi:hypothetical protein